MATRWTIRHGLILLWFKDLMKVTENCNFSVSFIESLIRVASNHVLYITVYIIPNRDVRVNFFHSKHMFRVIDTITSRWSSRWRGIDKTSTIFTMFWHFLQCQDKSNRLCSISGHSGQNIFGNQFFRFFNRLLVPSKPQYLLNNFPKILKIKTSFCNDIWIGYFLINSTFKLKQPHMLFSP